MNSRDRVLAAVRGEPVDYVPCSPFINYLLGTQRVGYTWQLPWGPSDYEYADYGVKKLGLDVVLTMPVPDYEPADGAESRVWLDGDVLHKTWTTPAGELSASIRYNYNWIHGFDIPFFSDFNVGHYVQPWLETRRDLECLKYILQPVRNRKTLDTIAFHQMEAGNLAQRYGLATIAHVGMGLTGAQQLCGAEPLCTLVIDDPDLINDYLQLEHEWNLARIAQVSGSVVDIVRRNGFYETADFYSPAMLERFLKKRLDAEADAIRKAGMASGYTVHTGVMPMLDVLNSYQFDCIMHIDTGFKGVDLDQISRRLTTPKSFWLGPSNTFHMFSDDPQVVRDNVTQVFDAFGDRGLLLTACPSTHSIMPWANMEAMIDQWRQLRDTAGCVKFFTGAL